MNKHDWFEACHIEGSKLWFVPVDYAFLVEYNLEKRREENIFFLPGGFRNKHRAFSKIIKYKDKLFLVPQSECSMLIFDIIKAEFVIVEIPGFDVTDEDFIQSNFINEKFIIMSRQNSNLIAVFCVENEGFFSERLVEPLTQKEIKLRGNCFQNGKNIYCSSFDDNCIIKLDIDERIKVDEKIPIGDEENLYTTLVGCQDLLYMYIYNSDEGKFISYDEASKKVGTFVVDKQIEKSINYMGAAVMKKNVLFFPSITGGHIVCINADGNIAEYKIKECMLEQYKFSFFKTFENGFYMYEMNSNSVIMLKDGVWSAVFLTLGIMYENAKKLSNMKEHFKDDFFARECADANLNVFINYITEK